jgi:hypothetical protein
MLTTEQVSELEEKPHDHLFSSCSVILIVAVGLAVVEAVAFLVPIVLLMIHVSVRMRGY